MIRKLNLRGPITVTINTTEDCNLACKYCYEINKKHKTMDFESAKKFIDILLDDDDFLKSDLISDDIIKNCKDSITIDFIGGDALMQPKLLDKILSYWVGQVYTRNTQNALNWRHNWKGSISSNGTLFSNPEVRAFIEDWYKVLTVGVSIDGCPTIHDENRIFVDGKPSMPEIIKWWPWYQKYFPIDGRTTKATCSKNSIPYLYESLKFMHEELGIKWIHQNFIMEDMNLEESDLKLMRDQMEKCIQYVYDHRDNLYWSMIDEHEFANHKRSEGEEWESKGRCGGGAMPALGIDGKIYPCFRFLPHTQDYKGDLIICGDLEKGLYNKEGFSKVTNAAVRKNCTKDPKCIDCEYESACSYCIAGCYSEFGEFKRTTYICEITKIQCEYAKKYWNRLKAEGLYIDRGVPR